MAELKYLISLPVYNGRTSLPLKEGKLCHLGQTDPLHEGGSVSGLLCCIDGREGISQKLHLISQREVSEGEGRVGQSQNA